jgi:hypothetical protein
MMTSDSFVSGSALIAALLSCSQSADTQAMSALAEQDSTLGSSQKRSLSTVGHASIQGRNADQDLAIWTAMEADQAN